MQIQFDLIGGRNDALAVTICGGSPTRRQITRLAEVLNDPGTAHVIAAEFADKAGVAKEHHSQID